MNLYELFQVQPNAHSEIIQAAYRRLILRYHPDRNKSIDAQEMTQKLNSAYEILSDPVKRAAYDREFSGGSEGAPHREKSDRSPVPPPSSSARPTIRYIERLPLWAWLTLIGGALAIAAALIAGGAGVQIDWFSDKPQVVEDRVIETVEDERARVIESLTTANTIKITPEPLSSSPAPIAIPVPPPTAIPTSVPIQPTLTVRQIFILESAGEITPEIAALLLRLGQRGLSPSPDQAGIITMTHIAQTEDVCVYVDCVGGLIPTAQDDEITLIIEVEPINPIVDLDYTVWLADLEGITLNSETIQWSADQLNKTSTDEANPEAISTNEIGRVISVSMTIPFDSISVPAFIEDYNEIFLSGLEKYENEAILECELSIGPNGSLQVGKQECRGKTFPPYQLESSQFAAVLERHFTIDLMLESEFFDRGLSKSDQQQK